MVRDQEPRRLTGRVFRILYPLRWWGPEPPYYRLQRVAAYEAMVRPGRLDLPPGDLGAGARASIPFDEAGQVETLPELRVWALVREQFPSRVAGRPPVKLAVLRLAPALGRARRLVRA
jgi:hypothetical protein